MDQGTEEWFKARLGKITASRFHDVMTRGRGGDSWGLTAKSYMLELIAERLTGDPQEKLSGVRSVEWGNKHEDDARALYCWRKEIEVPQAGFIGHYDELFAGWVGGSPDGLIGDDGGVEIKCPQTTRTHIEYSLGGECPAKYWWQVQGLMWVTGRSWWDFVSYDPRMPREKCLFVVRVDRDDGQIADLERRVVKFIAMIEVYLKKLDVCYG